MAVPDSRPRRQWLRQTLIALGSGMAGLLIGTQVAQAEPPPGTFDFFRDAPVGCIIHYEGSLSAHANLPGGLSPKWTVIGADRVLVGTASEIEAGTEGGSESIKTEGSHTGAEVGDHAAHVDHVMTQPGPHVDHAFTQPGPHSDHAAAGAHTHDPHSSVLALGAILSGVLTGPITHSSDGGHAHDPHSAHAGGAVDAHSAHADTAVDAHSSHLPHVVIQSDSHAIKQWRACFSLKKTVA